MTAVLQDSWGKSHNGTLCASMNYVIDHMTDRHTREHPVCPHCDWSQPLTAAGV